MIDSLSFLSDQHVRDIATQHGTPLYVYSQQVLTRQAKQALAFGAPFGFSVRYAIKANPHPDILHLFDGLGLVFDASSGEEAEHIMAQGIAAQKIALNSQQLPKNFAELSKAGVHITATSLHQLEQIGAELRGAEIGVRLNPGLGSGASNRVTTGGIAAGFGIWHEQIANIKAIAATHDLHITKVHTHIGAGTDPDVWQDAAQITLNLAKQFIDVTTVSLGGGFKVARMQSEQTADLQIIGARVTELLRAYKNETSKELHLEIEPGTYLSANAGVLLSEIIDVTHTGADGYDFLRLNTGMNDILRPTLYGAQHPLVIVPAQPDEELQTKQYVVIGHNCESGDLLTPAKGDPETIEPRELQQARIGDLLAIEGAGAYCASMRAVGYNSFTPAQELFLEDL